MILLLGIVFSMPSCSDDKDHETETPSYVLSREKYTELLTKLALTESVYTNNPLNLSGDGFDTVYNFNVLKELDISKAQYDSSMVFYNKHPKLGKEIHDEVLAKLSAMMSSVNGGTNGDTSKKLPAPGQY